MKSGLPIVILVMRDKCDACEYFSKQHLAKMLNLLSNKINFFTMKTSDEELLPSFLNPHVRGFPTLILVEPKVFLKFFTESGKIRVEDGIFPCKIYGIQDGRQIRTLMETVNPGETAADWVKFEIS